MTLHDYYVENATQARHHEEQRDKMTGTVLTVAGILAGFVTYSDLSVWSIPASIALMVLGLFGFLFAGKHYERFRRHTTIMGHIRKEISQPSSPPKTTSMLKDEADIEHYGNFRWPVWTASQKNLSQKNAISWIARQRLHIFWEAFHIFVILIGLGLTAATIGKALKAQDESSEKSSHTSSNSKSS